MNSPPPLRGCCPKVSRWADADEVAIGVGDDKGPAEDVVVRLLDHVSPFGYPRLIEGVYCSGRPGDHEDDFAGARHPGRGVLVAPGPDREEHAGATSKATYRGLVKSG